MDMADMADKHIEERLQLALSQNLAKRRTGASAGYSTVCEECGEPIPAERHKVLPDCATCVDCANLLEQANHIWGKDVGTWWI